MKVIEIPGSGALRVRFLLEPEDWDQHGPDFHATARVIPNDQAVRIRVPRDLANRLVKVYELIGSLQGHEFALRDYVPDAHPWPEWSEAADFRISSERADGAPPKSGNPFRLSEDEIIAALIP